MLRRLSLALPLLLATASACSVDAGEGMTSLSGGGASSFTNGDGNEAAGDTQGSGGESDASTDTDASGTTSGDGDDDSSASGTTGTSDDGGSTSAGDSGDTSGGDGDGGSDTSTTTGGTGGSGDPLDPDLDVPPEGNTPCSTPGSLNECGPLEVCRFYDSEEGRCESCTGCGNLNAFCSDGTDCDILFMCYQNTCTNFCTLGTYECGPIEACVNIGHPTKGVCQP